jgi:hypothetical protein
MSNSKVSKKKKKKKRKKKEKKKRKKKKKKEKKKLFNQLPSYRQSGFMFETCKNEKKCKTYDLLI